FRPSILGSAKNASFDSATGRIGGTTATGGEAEALRLLMQRFSDAALALVRDLCPAYGSRIERRRASFRPAEIAGRTTTWRKDDTRLHVGMKADADFQAHTPQTAIEFPAGSTWMAFTDQVSHAAMAGQYQLEQTFLLPVDAMGEPERSPLRVLERLMGRRLA